MGWGDSRLGWNVGHVRMDVWLGRDWRAWILDDCTNDLKPHTPRWRDLDFWILDARFWDSPLLDHHHLLLLLQLLCWVPGVKARPSELLHGRKLQNTDGELPSTRSSRFATTASPSRLHGPVLLFEHVTTRPSRSSYNSSTALHRLHTPTPTPRFPLPNRGFH